ncbi:hypothetical protein [Kocuria turfanensis]|nr:hypothetical protein [Kocuria turfanensis]
MKTLTRSALSLAFAGALSLVGATAATAAPGAHPNQDRITQSSCEADGSTYSFSKGIRSCETTTTETVIDVPRRAAVTPLEGLTYHHGTYHQETTTTTTSTSAQRGKQTPTVTATDPVIEQEWVLDACLRIDNYGTPQSTRYLVDGSECEQRPMYWGDGSGYVRP